MSLDAILVPLLTHFIPMLFFFYMAIEVWIRNPSSVEHRLVGITAVCFMMLFAEEYVRHQLPLAYSPFLTIVWFSSAGILIPGLGFHLFVKLAQLDRRMPKYVYPYIFYLPLVIVILNLVTHESTISAVSFSQQGIWKLPDYNLPYYIAMTASVVNNFLYLIPLWIGRKRAASQERRKIFNELILGVLLSGFWFAGFGLFQFGSALPPYPYIYGGIVWCIYLRRTMKNYDFLNFSDKRYEKLFNLNPSAILLIDLHGKVKDANPAAILLLQSISLNHRRFYESLSDEIRMRIERREVIRDAEMTVQGANGQLIVLIDGDYVQVEHHPYVILILRDMTVQTQIQREIAFLAYHDPLTRLPNRRYFQQLLEEAVRRAASEGEKLAAVLIDLDRFKEINDNYGHQAGDEVLQLAAGAIREAVGESGVAARLGGDEFVFFLYPSPSKQEVQALMDALGHAFSQLEPAIDDRAVPIGMSIGASFYPEDGQDVDALLNQADKAMYRVKRKRKQETQAASESE